MVCRYCGRSYPDIVPVCPGCGAPNETPPSADGEEKEAPAISEAWEEEIAPPQNEIKGFRRFAASFLCVLSVLIMLATVGMLFYWNGRENSSAPPAPSTEALETTAAVTTTAPPVRIRVPDTVGMRTDDAVDTLAEAGLTALVQDTVTADKPEGFVIGQSPGAGEETEKGGKVTLSVAVPPDR